MFPIQNSIIKKRKANGGSHTSNLVLMTVNGRKVLAAMARAEAPNAIAWMGDMFLSVFL